MACANSNPPWTYNAKPAWLTMAHQQLDQAVAAAYGWADYTPETVSYTHLTLPTSDLV